MKHHPLLLQTAQQPVGHLRDLLAAEHADQVIDLRPRFEQRLALPLGQTARDDHALELAAPFEVEHLIDGGKRLLPRGLDKPARVHDRKISPPRIIDQLIAIELQQPQHPLAVDEILRAAQADECIAALRRAARKLIGESVYHVKN